MQEKENVNRKKKSQIIMSKSFKRKKKIGKSKSNSKTAEKEIKRKGKPKKPNPIFSVSTLQKICVEKNAALKITSTTKLFLS